MMNKKQKFIIDIVPLTKIPMSSHQSFSYLSDAKISIGTLVSIPLFHRSVEGIVLGTRQDFERLGNIELKKIEKIIVENFLSDSQIELAKFISDYYISPLGVVMKNFVPKRAKIRNKKPASSAGKQKEIILTPEQKNAIAKISLQTKSYKLEANSYLLFGPAGSGKTEVYINSILELRKQNKNFQFLIIIPEKTLTPQAMERYGAYFEPEEIVVLSSNISKGQFYSNWKKIQSGEAKLILGTRMAVFAPFKKLGLIVIDEEQDMSFKQWDMNPRYDARTVAEKLAEIHECKIVRGSATPSIESYYRAINKDLKLVELPKLLLADSPLEGGLSASIKTPTTSIVDMKKERWTKNYTCISRKLKGEIEYALKNKQQSILFINRQGMSSFSICEACKAVLKCPKCERALVYEKGGFYKCNHCNYKTSIFPKCEKCGGISFKNVGLGTQKVEKEISSLFPLAKIIVADTASSKELNFHEKIYGAFSKGEADILIGTQMISKGWDLPRVSLVGIIDADNLLSFPDFSAEEKAFQIISQLAGRVNRPGARFPGEVVIQTYQPENKIIQLASENNFQSFFQKIIEERKALNFPPYGKIVKLVFQDYNFEKVEKESQDTFESFENIKGLKISEPHTPLLSKIRGRWRKQMIVKFPDKIPIELEKEIRKLKSGWVIDRDPISII
ncbi:MAG: Primosomal protein N' [Candidatus Moranbacteria bacterium GW2011_GWF2_36_839]|nr:MAG: Primosomal protein N' [Candidatus Moranbacteria bacterium GW2011_GWF1_36_78]KKQ17735.1 MAG: Primosomal protein N' [Candidatus Moranbacteria bacterium GW2011_GWF2_36_839]HAT73437.1 primosomal protein N' [Candidatus Moranbacteria bacterium]HBY10799.1 primosomal protein N' [Candidatus Moranbacteria bacterium]